MVRTAYGLALLISVPGLTTIAHAQVPEEEVGPETYAYVTEATPEELAHGMVHEFSVAEEATDS